MIIPAFTTSEATHANAASMNEYMLVNLPERVTEKKGKGKYTLGKPTLTTGKECTWR